MRPAPSLSTRSRTPLAAQLTDAALVPDPAGTSPRTSSRSSRGGSTSSTSPGSSAPTSRRPSPTRSSRACTSTLTGKVRLSPSLSRPSAARRRAGADSALVRVDRELVPAQEERFPVRLCAPRAVSEPRSSRSDLLLLFLSPSSSCRIARPPSFSYPLPFGVTLAPLFCPLPAPRGWSLCESESEDRAASREQRERDLVSRRSAARQRRNCPCDCVDTDSRLQLEERRPCWLDLTHSRSRPRTAAARSCARGARRRAARSCGNSR